MDGVVTANSDRVNCLSSNKEQDCKPDIACLFNSAPPWGERYTGVRSKSDGLVFLRCSPLV